jgi:transcriptional regulator with XRE-family HTH domain
VRTLTTYSKYNFIDKDPIFDRIWYIMDVQGITLRQLANESGMSYATLYGWRYGKTRQAYFSSIARVVIALRKWDFTLIEEKVAKGKLKLITGAKP